VRGGRRGRCFALSIGVQKGKLLSRHRQVPIEKGRSSAISSLVEEKKGGVTAVGGSLSAFREPTMVSTRRKRKGRRRKTEPD